MSISIHTGNPRTGKTYGMTKVILKALKEGTKVYSNYFIDWQGMWITKFNWKKFRFEKIWRPKELLEYWRRLEDLYSKEKGIIAMDEMHVYMNARKWALLPEEFEVKLYQHGKDGLHIIGTVQNIRRLDTIARELIDYWYSYEVFPPPPKDPWKKHKPRFFKQHLIIQETDLDSKRRTKINKIYFFRKKIADKYNTLQKIYSN